MNELARDLEELLKEIEATVKSTELDTQKLRLAELESSMQVEDFWSDQQKAAQTSQQHANLAKHIKTWEDLKQQTKEALELAKIGDHKLEKELQIHLKQLRIEFEKKEIETKLSGEYDQNNALLHIHSGTGGTDAQDWAQMLERMYFRWAEKNGFKSELISESAGEEAGIKSALLKINGEFAYGKLQGEHGVHRLVRLSPFNSDNLRQTSFALVEVLPEIPSTSNADIEPKDIRVDVYRSSGKGGQSVNTTDSAVRITHIPTGIVVAIQNERSQLQNRENAMNVLRSRLAHLESQRRAQKLSDLKGGVISAEWGAQIRNYVMHPYTLVKDTRTGYETHNVESVLDGEINEFIDSYLATKVTNK
jgi:peptide chain release factor 2